MNNNTPLISIVIGFRDWGLEKVCLCVKSHLSSSMSSSLEVIVVDYGSKNPDEVREKIEEVGGRVLRVDTDDVWSRSKALNYGIRQMAKGERIITTDSDIIFGPETIEVVIDEINNSEETENVFALVQCSDLNEDMKFDSLIDLPWDLMDQNSEPRPRFGMGGCACFPRAFLEEIRGYDERLSVWGGEDNDLVYRAERFGLDVKWITNEKAKIYHIWHEKTLQTHKSALQEYDEDTAKYSEAKDFFTAWDKNRDIANARGTCYRNLTSWGGLPSSPPTISVTICTYNRAVFLSDSIKSTLNQSFENFELVIVDDGSTDNTEEVVNSFEDPRVVYYKTEHQGIPHSRNFSVEKSRGIFICIMDDDDLMMPDRLKNHLMNLSTNSAGSYGGWIDFLNNDLTYNPGKERSLASILFTGKVMIHPASMIRKDILLQFPYNTDYSFGSDYDMNLRLVDAGHHMDHCGSYLIWRRIHDTNVTQTDSLSQRNTGRSAAQERLALLTKEEEKDLRKAVSNLPFFKINKIPSLYDLNDLLNTINPNTESPGKITIFSRIIEPLRSLYVRLSSQIKAYKFKRMRRELFNDLSQKHLFTSENVSEHLKRLIKNPIHLVIIGCGRSGTAFIGTHLDLGHEKLGRNGISAWQAAVDINPIYTLKSNDFILHQVRNPISTISSCHAFVMKESWSLIEANIHSINSSDSLLLKCMKYWYHWNLMAEKRALATYRVEDIKSEQPKNINTRKTWSSYRKVSWADLQAEDPELTRKIKLLASRFGYEI